MTEPIRLTKQGYIIPKSRLSAEQIEQIENDLTIEPELDQRFKRANSEDESFNIYLETVKGDKMVVPRYYGLNKFGNPDQIKFDINQIDKSNVKFKGELRDYQKEIMDKILGEYCSDIKDPSNSLKQYGGGIISIPPGKGKTVLGINLITQLGLRALIVVHKTFLLNQWKERIAQYTDAEVGIIQQNKIDISGKQIVIAMLQSVSLKDYDRELFQAFPLVIYDECHHLGAKMFSKSLIKIQAPFYLGLSATPERKDNLDKVFKYFLGDIAYRGKFEPNNQVKVRLYSYNIANAHFKTLYNRFNKTFLTPTMITNVCKIDVRNNLIVKIIKEILEAEPERKILVLTGRCNSSKNDKSIDHLKVLSDKLSEYEDFAESWGYYKGGMKRLQLEDSSLKQIIIGTYDMAQEGLDIADLDTLILASPLKGDITQTCGRILRGQNVCQPLIIDIVDQIKPFSEQARSRYGYYKMNKYNCEFFEIADGYKYDEDDGIIKLNGAFLTASAKSQKASKEEDLFVD
jgi:superfamily II DNA or RNA helicase